MERETRGDVGAEANADVVRAAMASHSVMAPFRASGVE